MSKWRLTTAEAVTVLFDHSGTFYTAPCGTLHNTEVENVMDAIARASYTLADGFIQVTTNGIASGSTFRSRVNGGNGNISVSVSASTTGAFEDTVNTDSISAGDLFNGQLVTGAGAHGDVFRVTMVGFTLEDTGGDLSIIVLDDIDSSFQTYEVGDSHVEPIQGIIVKPADTPTYIVRSTITFQNLFVSVDVNEIDSASDFALRKDTTNVITVSVPGDTTGNFEDTVDTETFSAGDAASYLITAGPTSAMGTDTIVWTILQSSLDHVGRITVLGAPGSISETFNITRSYALEGFPLTRLTGSEVQMVARAAIDAENYFLRLKSNTLNGSTTIAFGVDGVASSLGVSVPASTSGVFEDTSDVVSVLETEAMNHIIDTTSSSSGSIRTFYLGFEQVAGGGAAPPPVRRTAFGTQLLHRAA